MPTIRLSYPFRRVLLGSALIYSILRWLFPVHLTWDIGLQMQTAFRIVEGLGITTVAMGTPPLDLSQNPTPIPLGHWPPGYSLILAAFFKLGFSPELTTKLICATLTLLCWHGWSLCLEKIYLPLKKNLVTWSYALLLFLIVSALTPSWRGTDIILWAAAPYLVMRLAKILSTPQDRFILPASFGLFIGFLYLFRYASVFILIAVTISLVLTVTRHSFWNRLQQGLAVMGGFTLLWWPIHCFVSQPLSRPHLDISTLHWSNLPLGLLHIVADSAYLGTPLWAWLETTSRMHLMDQWPSAVITVGVMGFILFLPLYRLWKTSPDFRQETDYLLVALSTLTVSNLLMLIALSGLNGTEGWVREYRYYLPVQVSVILLFLNSVRAVLQKTSVPGHLLSCWSYLQDPPKYYQRLNRILALFLILAGILCSVPWFVPVWEWAQKGWAKRHPALGMETRLAKTRAVLLDLARQNPSALFYLSNYPLIMFLDPDPLNHFRAVPSADWWHSAYTSRETTLFWEVSYSPKMGEAYQIMSCVFYRRVYGLAEQLPLKVVQFIPEEQSLILSCTLPANFHFFANSAQ